MRFLIISLVFVSVINVDANVGEKVRLVDDLFQNYHKAIEPVGPKDDPLNITHMLQIRRLVGYEDGILTLDVWETLSWEDKRLGWKPDAYSDLASLSLPTDMLWTPDVEQLFSANELLPKNTEHARRLQLFSDGTILYPTHNQIMNTYKCQENKEWVSCDLQFSPWTYDGTVINVINQDDVLNSDLLHPGKSSLHFVSASARRNVVTYACCPQPYVDVTYTVTFIKLPKSA
ncbi:neuronal acetylcholine receptor subunit alpha-10-like isoform X2 [Dreissena polymorpha]|uniref:Neurotransmitter-gated ion-channel ligand-binding domain-containing protein n=1 Tax=Dreissena polymorpha TaxID=45954 RepID=A0A9D3YCL8_DREPO|nr:neuronal acetylcholine receptor subunit alpha-10-like isoform X2 [Dreissena polymorpha]KAH3696676.1 hypothetical protein DPMN_084152 [Dreissena polymorpha]